MKELIRRTNQMKIRIVAGKLVVPAELNESRTAQSIRDALPIEARGNTWGDEIYFSIPVSESPEQPKSVVEIGDLAYWPPGDAFCIFFGRTPASRGNEIRPASPVNVFGKITGDPLLFKQVPDGALIRIEADE
jgi:hypothetical protein